MFIYCPTHYLWECEYRLWATMLRHSEHFWLKSSINGTVDSFGVQPSVLSGNNLLMRLHCVFGGWFFRILSIRRENARNGGKTINEENKRGKCFQEKCALCVLWKQFLKWFRWTYDISSIVYSISIFLGRWVGKIWARWQTTNDACNTLRFFRTRLTSKFWKISCHGEGSLKWGYIISSARL